MRIIHIASHRGNIGDIINHEGFYKEILQLSKEDELVKIEMRDFYFNSGSKRRFDREFADYLNLYDLVILGGGGFFDAQWSGSYTGTTLNVSDEFLDALETKVIVNAMGYHEYPGKTNEEILGKFERFLAHILVRDNWFVSVRNDGSYQRLIKSFGENKLYGLLQVADNGFFCDFIQEQKKEIQEKKIVGMCITNDLFSAEFNGEVTTNSFNDYIAAVVNRVCECGYDVMFLPHIPSDIEIINCVLNGVNNDNKRNHVMIGSLDCCGIYTVERTASNYKMCDVIVGMRFHSLITGINCNIPTIALAGHEQIVGLFTELSLDEYLIKLDNLCFSQRLIDLIEYCLDKPEELQKKYKSIYDSLEEKKCDYRNRIKSFLLK